MKKAFAAITLAASLTGLGAATAHAADTYPAPAASVGVSAGTVNPGATVTFAGHGFKPGEKIIITVASAGTGTGGGTGVARSVALRIPLANQTVNTVADSAGAFSVDVVMTDPGTYTLTAVGATSGITQTSTITVSPAQAAAAPAKPADLAMTGVDPGLVLWGLVGAGALAAGAGSVVAVRRGGRSASAS